MIIVLIKKKI